MLSREEFDDVAARFPELQQRMQEEYAVGNRHIDHYSTAEQLEAQASAVREVAAEDVVSLASEESSVDEGSVRSSFGARSREKSAHWQRVIDTCTLRKSAEDALHDVGNDSQFIAIVKRARARRQGACSEGNGRKTAGSPAPQGKLAANNGSSRFRQLNADVLKNPIKGMGTLAADARARRAGSVCPTGKMAQIAFAAKIASGASRRARGRLAGDSSLGAAGSMSDDGVEEASEHGRKSRPPRQRGDGLIRSGAAGSAGATSPAADGTDAGGEGGRSPGTLGLLPGTHGRSDDGDGGESATPGLSGKPGGTG